MPSSTGEQIDKACKILRELRQNLNRSRVAIEQLQKETGWSKKISRSQSLIAWHKFDLILREEDHLQGSSNWELWHARFRTELSSIGYKDTPFLKAADESKLATLILANIREGPKVLVAGMDKGTLMLKTLEESYRLSGRSLQFSLWQQLATIQWTDEKHPWKLILELKFLFGRCDESDMPTNTNQQIAFLLMSVGNSGVMGSREWVTRMKEERPHQSQDFSWAYRLFLQEFQRPG